jgi:hypothetical protein
MRLSAGTMAFSAFFPDEAPGNRSNGRFRVRFRVRVFEDMEEKTE